MAGSGGKKKTNNFRYFCCENIANFLCFFVNGIFGTQEVLHFCFSVRKIIFFLGMMVLAPMGPTVSA